MIGSANRVDHGETGITCPEARLADPTSARRAPIFSPPPKGMGFFDPKKPAANSRAPGTRDKCEPTSHISSCIILNIRKIESALTMKYPRRCIGFGKNDADLIQYGRYCGGFQYLCDIDRRACKAEYPVSDMPGRCRATVVPLVCSMRRCSRDQWRQCGAALPTHTLAGIRRGRDCRGGRNLAVGQGQPVDRRAGSRVRAQVRRDARP